MKTKTMIMLVVIFTTLNTFAQKEAVKPVYTFCGKSGDCTINLEDFKNAKKELTTIDKNVKVTSFNVSLLVISADTKDSVYVDYSNSGNVFSQQSTEAVEKFLSQKQIVGKILIEEVKVSEGDKTWKTAGMVIKVK